MPDEQTNPTQPEGGAADTSATPPAPAPAPAIDLAAFKSALVEDLTGTIHSIVGEAVTPQLDGFKQELTSLVDSKHQETFDHLNKVRAHLALPAIKTDGSHSSLPRDFHAYVRAVVLERGGNPNADGDLEAATPEARRRWEEDYPPEPLAEEGFSNEELLAQASQLMQQLADRGLLTAKS